MPGRNLFDVLAEAAERWGDREFAAKVRAEIERWSRVVKSAGIKAD